MDKRKIEFYVGLFVIIGLFCACYLFAVLGEISLIRDKQYTVSAYFSSVSGLKTGASVEMAGVEIGTVSRLNIDPERLMAHVEVRINKNIRLTDDSIASIKTAGIIGQKYIEILPGGSDTLLEDGDEIEFTESALDIESLIRKMIFSNETK